MTSAQDRYQELLQEYFQSGSEECLYRASLLSQEFVRAGIPPTKSLRSTPLLSNGS